MSISPRSFLEQGFRLLAGSEEVDYRTAISRSYYAAYHTAVDTAERINLPQAGRRDTGAHEQLIARFESKGRGLKRIAQRLRAKKRMRAMADYQLDAFVLEGEAVLQMKEVQALVEDIESLGCICQEVAE